MEHKSEKAKETTTTSTESKGVLGSVWSAVSHAVQGTVDRIQHDAEPVTTVAGYVAGVVMDTASAMYNKASHGEETTTPIVEESKVDAYDSFLSSPTDDILEATKEEKKEEDTTKQSDIISDVSAKTGDLLESAKKVVGDVVSGVTAKASDVLETAKQTVTDATSNIKADGLLESMNQIANLNIKNAAEAVKDEGDFKLELTMDVVAHLQRIADRTGDALLHETARKAHSACAKGQTDAPGVHLVRVTPEQATELVNLAIMTQDHELANFARYCQSVAATAQVGIEPSPGKIQEELAKGRKELNTQGRVHTGPGYGAAFASISRSTSATNVLASVAPLAKQELKAESSEAPITPASDKQLTMDMVAHLQRIADRTGDKVLHDTARKAHSACAKGVSDAPGVHLVTVTPDQASELVNLAIRTQDHELANFARYCQSVAATTQLGIEPEPGKIAEEISKGRQELQQQGRTHTGPGYGAAFASISRSNSSSSLGKTSRSASPTNVPLAQEIPTDSTLQLTMDVVAHLQRIADRTGDTVLHDTARKAHSACAKNLNEAPGVHLTRVTPDQATELVNLAIRTQDHELADFARYCQSVAATTQIAVEPSPGKIQEEIEKGRLELQQQGRTHTGPGYGAAFASKQHIKTEPQAKVEQDLPFVPASLVGQPSQ